MSKKLSTLNKIQELRANGNTATEPEPLIPGETKARASGLTKSVFAALIGLNLIFTLILFLVILGYRSAGNNLNTKLAKIEELLNTNSEQIQSFANGVTQDLKDTNTKVSQLEKALNTQASDIASLIKASNNLLSKINLMETKVAKLSGGQ